MIVSIGYSACHWCHVMEHECFENEEVAQLMNEHFISIKVDREERPDVDQVYMNALQVMTSSGGWPLNMIVLPDGRPLWGGTYIPKPRWIGILEQLANFYKQKPQEAAKYADEVSKGMKQFEPSITPTLLQTIPTDFIHEIVNSWSDSFDKTNGGTYGSPKFPLPTNLSFLLEFGVTTSDKTITKHICLTLDKMAFGGIFDQIEGGFARYSTDAMWHIPHFEKMLYDNAQLVSLYSNAYKIFGLKRYQQVVEDTLSFVTKKLTAAEGGCYSALDADSEGEEGKYYVWTKYELESVLGDKFDLFADYYNINDIGHWEDENYVLTRNETDEEFAQRHHLNLSDLEKQVILWRKMLLPIREQRPAPQLDDKVLTSWNALMLTGYIDAYIAFDTPKYLESAIQIGQFLTTSQLRKDGGLFHCFKQGKSTVNGHLDDYAFAIQALLKLFNGTLNEKWLSIAIELLKYTNTHFSNPETGLYYFTSDEDKALFSRATDIHDNVLPSGNAVMANNLHEIGLLTGNIDFIEKAKVMTTNIVGKASSYPSGYTEWLRLLSGFQNKSIEVVVTGKQANQVLQLLRKQPFSHCYLTGCTQASDYLIFKNRYIDEQLNIYICNEGTCGFPLNNVADAINEIQRLMRG